VVANLTPLASDVVLKRKNRAMEKPRKHERTAITLRLPQALHKEITDAAALAGHSTNEEIVLRLQAHPQALTLGQIAQQNVELKRMVQQLIDMQS
jgi:predicted HicB family RNase H-like nuclease